MLEVLRKANKPLGTYAIAQELGVEKKEINKYLYKLLHKGIVVHVQQTPPLWTLSTANAIFQRPPSGNTFVWNTASQSSVNNLVAADVSNSSNSTYDSLNNLMPTQESDNFCLLRAPCNTKLECATHHYQLPLTKSTACSKLTDIEAASKPNFNHKLCSDDSKTENLLVCDDIFSFKLAGDLKSHCCIGKNFVNEEPVIDFVSTNGINIATHVERAKNVQQGVEQNMQLVARGRGRGRGMAVYKAFLNNSLVQNNRIEETLASNTKVDCSVVSSAALSSNCANSLAARRDSNSLFIQNELPQHLKSSCVEQFENANMTLKIRERKVCRNLNKTEMDCCCSQQVTGKEELQLNGACLGIGEHSGSTANDILEGNSCCKVPFSHMNWCNHCEDSYFGSEACTSSVRAKCVKCEEVDEHANVYVNVRTNKNKLPSLDTMTVDCAEVNNRQHSTEQPPAFSEDSDLFEQGKPFLLYCGLKAKLLIGCGNSRRKKFF